MEVRSLVLDKRVGNVVAAASSTPELLISLM
jgi:hypothetical protein